jgi:hypothetical protein
MDRYYVSVYQPASGESAITFFSSKEEAESFAEYLRASLQPSISVGEVEEE